MILLLASGMLLAGSAGFTLLRPASTRSHRFDLTVCLALTACFLGAGAATYTLVSDTTADVSLAWHAPGASFALHLDPLSALFLLPIFVVGGLGMVYGREYWAQPDGRQPRTAWSWYYLFLFSMALVTLAANAVLFLVAWEAMSIAAFFLVTHEDDRPEVRQAGWTFLIAAHLGTAFLFVMFAILGRSVDVLDFSALAASPMEGRLVGAVFLLALVGFGTKAGLVPAHVWLPAAHPAAPSHVSAVLSGAMLKMGIYGLLRTLTLLPALPSWAGWLLIAVGLGSGVFGIVFALAQRDLKRLLADSSIENLGVITAGVGIGVVGVQHRLDVIAVLGFSGALLHVLNHALFKGLLFLVSGSVLHATGTRDMDELGGLMRRMPWTAALFFVGAAAITGLPPLNGFVSEFLLYLAAFEGLGSGDAAVVVAMLAVILGLTLIGGLAAATFLRAALAFTGHPRSGRAAQAHDPGRTMRLPMAALAGGCAVIGVLPAAAVWLIGPAVAQVSRVGLADVREEVAPGAALTGVALSPRACVVSPFPVWRSVQN